MNIQEKKLQKEKLDLIFSEREYGDYILKTRTQ